MDELNFRLWLKNNSYSKKVESDVVSRLKKLERELHYIDIEKEYSKDNCSSLLLLFKNKGENKEMTDIDPSSLPIGKYQLSSYKYSVTLYIKYLNSLL